MEYVYTVWFRDTSAEPDDQDREWPACIVIDADRIDDATAWGDHLAKRFSNRRSTEQFLRSQSEPIDAYSDADMSSTPRVACGHEATDEEIGW